MHHTEVCQYTGTWPTQFDAQDSDVITEAIKELGDSFPSVVGPLLHERDAYMVAMLRQLAAQCVACLHQFLTYRRVFEVDVSAVAHFGCLHGHHAAPAGSAVW